MSCGVCGEPSDYIRATVNGVDSTRQLRVSWTVSVPEVSAFTQQSSQRTIVCTDLAQVNLPHVGANSLLHWQRDDFKMLLNYTDYFCYCYSLQSDGFSHVSAGITPS